MKDKISVEMLDEFEARTLLFGSYGNGHNKSIEIVVRVATKRVWFELKHFSHVIAKGSDLKEIIDMYNKIPEITTSI